MQLSKWSIKFLVISYRFTSILISFHDAEDQVLNLQVWAYNVKPSRQEAYNVKQKYVNIAVIEPSKFNRTFSDFLF